jgi:hypothetical protein
LQYGRSFSPSFNPSSRRSLAIHGPSGFTHSACAVPHSFIYASGRR